MCTVDILRVAPEPVWLIQCETPIAAGFPSPAEDEQGRPIDLNEILLPHPGQTYLARVKGTSMDGPPTHIRDGALLAVDCARKHRVGDVVVAVVEGDFTIKRIEKRGETYWLVPDNPAFSALPVRGEGEVRVWGVVTHVINELIAGRLHHHVRARRL